MSKELAHLPVARNWRDIPQRVKPRAMSREGRRRLAAGVLRAAGAAAALAAVGWAGWQVRAALKGENQDLPAGAQGEPIGDHLELTTDGVLDRAWLGRTLALPRNMTLNGLDLLGLRARLLAGGQVAEVALIKSFPSTLVVRLSERTPVARVLAQAGAAAPRAFLVARDGTVYQGTGYDSAMVASLPWLDGVSLTPRGAGFAPLAGMTAVADLLARAKLEAEPIYRTWQIVSLARLQSDGEIEVRAQGGLKVIFDAQQDFLGQLGRLDVVLDATRGRAGPPVREIDLALGPQVPVAFGASAPAPTASPPVPLFSSFLPTPSPSP